MILILYGFDRNYAKAIYDSFFKQKRQLTDKLAL